MPIRGKAIRPSVRARVIELSESHTAQAIARLCRISRSAVYKIRHENNHYKSLSETALALAKNFEKYRSNPVTFLGSGHYVGDTIYGESEVFRTLAGLDEIDRGKALDLLHHLREEFAELENINDWGELEDLQITPAFINRLELKAHEQKFKGRCPHCP
jgi:hypothetical protein